MVAEFRDFLHGDYIFIFSIYILYKYIYFHVFLLFRCSVTIKVKGLISCKTQKEMDGGDGDL